MVHCCYCSSLRHSVTLTSVCRVSARLSSYPGYLQMCHIQQSIITSITMTHIYYRVSGETGILVQALRTRSCVLWIFIKTHKHMGKTSKHLAKQLAKQLVASTRITVFLDTLYIIHHSLRVFIKSRASHINT